MYTVPKIPGVSLEVYKQDRQLSPESDGYVGRLCSGFTSVLAVIDSNDADHGIKTIGLFRDGQDHYILQKDWLNSPVTDAQQQAHKMYLAGRSFNPRTKVFGVKIPLRVDERNVINFVSYPENMLMLVQYHCGSYPNPNSPDFVLVWKVALVSQNGDFFLTVQEAYDLMICNGDGKLQIPRIKGHHQLEKIILANMPEGFRFSTNHRNSLPERPDVNELGRNEGIVERWYAARNMGCILTKKGPARVHWNDVPARPRLRFLTDGERVRFANLCVPPRNPSTEWRKVRKARFQLQAYGIEII